MLRPTILRKINLVLLQSQRLSCIKSESLLSENRATKLQVAQSHCFSFLLFDTASKCSAWQGVYVYRLTIKPQVHFTMSTLSIENLFGVKGYVALVTGGSSGLGFMICKV